MKKEAIRPILLEELEKAQSAELEVHKAAPEGLEWPELTQLLETRAEARLRRAVAELQLWLADRQWEREETQEREGTWRAQGHILGPPNASQTTKP